MVDAPIKIIVINFNHKMSIQRVMCEFLVLPLIFKLPIWAFYLDKGRLVKYRSMVLFIFV